MISVLFFFISFLFGLTTTRFFLPQKLQKDIIKFPLSLVFGLFLLTWSTFLLNIFLSLQTSIMVTLYVATILGIFFVPRRHSRSLIQISLSSVDIILLIIACIISFWLIVHSLLFTNGNTLQIASNEWGDFSLHLPLIRSFAWGGNVPPSLPSYPQADLAYHFMFDYFSGILEYGGFPLSWAFNIASIVGLTTLLFSLYKFISLLFNNKKTVGILAMIFFLFNSTLEFIEGYAKLHPSNVLDYFSKIFNNNQYLSVGPFTNDHVSIIWSMNVYLNQRHLIFSFAIGILILIIIHSFLEEKISLLQALVLGILIGLTPLWDMYVFMCLVVIISMLGIFSIKQNKFVFLSIAVGCLLAFPQAIWLSRDVQSFMQWNPGFLAARPLTFNSFVTYWWYNLGLSSITITLGFLLAHTKQKKWFLAFLSIFLLGNLFQFNKDMFNNHKLFNFWMLLSNGYTAYVIYFLLQRRTTAKWFLLLPLLFLLTFSGIIDTFVIKNEHFYTINDYHTDALISWAMQTPKDAIFLTSGDTMYDPILLAGRKTFTYNPRFAEDMGYNVAKRNLLVQQLFAAANPTQETVLLTQNNITFVELPKTTQPNFQINKQYFLTKYPLVFQNNTIEILQIH